MASEKALSIRGAAFRTKPLSLAKTCSIGLSRWTDMTVEIIALTVNAAALQTSARSYEEGSLELPSGRPRFATLYTRRSRSERSKLEMSNKW
jgi:hypothetical protein